MRMFRWFVLVVACAIAASSTRPQQDAALDDVFLGFSNYALVDDLVVTIGLGRPVQLYHLRVVFSGHLYNTSEAIGHITLYNSQTLRTSSSTYQSVVPGRVGYDIVEVSGLRWVALINTRPNAWHGAHTSDTIDGLLYVGFDESPAPGNYWQGFFANRLGVTWTHAANDVQHLRATEGRAFLPLQNFPSYPPGMPLAVRGIGYVDNVNVVGYSSRMRVVVAPDMHVTYVPLDLFRWYFATKNLYSDQPAFWNPLTLHFPLHDWQLEIGGSILFPLRDNTGSTRDNTYEVTRILKLLVSASSEQDPDLATLTNIESTAASGYNTLKIMPHSWDNETIYLGGHALWSTISIVLDYGDDHAQADPHFALVLHTLGSDMTLTQCLLIALAILLFVRWKLDASYVDYVYGHDGYVHHYHVIITADSIVWPFLLPLWSTPLVFVWYGPHAAVSLELGVARLVTWLFWVCYIVALGMSVYFWYLNGTTLWHRWRRQWHRWTHHFGDHLRHYVRYVGQNIGRDESDIVFEQPYLGASLLVSQDWMRTPAYATHDEKNRGKFFWCPPMLLIARDCTLTILCGVALWSVVSPMDSPLFALVLSMLILLVVVYSAAHHFLSLTYFMFWPALSRHRPTRVLPPPLAVGIWVGLIVCNVVLFYLFHHIIIGPMLELTSLFYGNSDDNVHTIMLLFIMAVLFVISQFTYSYLLQRFLPHKKRNSKQKESQQHT